MRSIQPRHSSRSEGLIRSLDRAIGASTQMSNPTPTTAARRARFASTLTGLLVLGALFVAERLGVLEALGLRPPVEPAVGAVAVPSGTQQILEAFRRGRSGLLVGVDARVERMLPDDDDGDRHQRFIVRLAGSDHTVLVAHNIDLAPRVPLKKGDEVSILGEYEPNDVGGVVHWTHHDPAGRHPDGWIRHAGKTYK